MPREKKKAPPPHESPLCTPPSRRLLQSMTIHDIPQGRIICLPSSLSPSPSVSRMCICGQEECCPPTCRHLKNNQDALRNGQQPEQEKPIESPACKDGVEGIPCCRDILRKLAQEVLAFSDSHLDKRVCVRDNKSEATPPCCVSSKLVTSLPECSTKTCPISKSFNSSSKKDFCCDVPDCQDTELFEESTKPIQGNQEKPVMPKGEVCSIASCARDFSLKSSRWTNTDSEASSTRLDKQSDYASNGTPKLRAMPHPTPAPSRKSSINIGKNSSMKLIGGTSDVKNEEPKQKKSYFKLFGRSSKNKVKNDEDKEESKKSQCTEDKKKNSKKDKKDTLTQREETCNNINCKTKTCTCRFPPAYNEYYDCTGQISGICNCENENSQNNNNNM